MPELLKLLARPSGWLLALATLIGLGVLKNAECGMRNAEWKTLADPDSGMRHSALGISHSAIHADDEARLALALVLYLPPVGPPPGDPPPPPDDPPPPPPPDDPPPPPPDDPPPPPPDDPPPPPPNDPPPPPPNDPPPPPFKHHPEPGTLISGALGAGLLALFGWRRRKT